MTDEREPELEPEPAQLPVAPNQVKQVALEEIDDLGRFVAGLTGEDWTKPSAVNGWTVEDVVAHLNLALGLYGRLLDAAFAGRGGGRAWKAFGELSKKAGPTVSSAFNAVNSAIPRAISGALSPEVIQGQFAAGERKVRERVERVDSADYTRPIHYMGRPWPLSFFLAAMVNELAVHGWDMRSRLDPAAHLSDGARAVLPWFYWSGTPFMLRLKQEVRGTVQVKLVDPATEMWWGIDAGAVRQGTGEVQAEATISGEAGTFVLTLAGRISADDAMRATSITAEGDAELARVFLGGWKIV